jgi:hypothetical protein
MEKPLRSETEGEEQLIDGPSFKGKDNRWILAAGAEVIIIK